VRAGSLANLIQTNAGIGGNDEAARRDKGAAQGSIERSGKLESAMTTRDKEILEGLEVILAEMAKWHAALEAVHKDVREVRRMLEELGESL
jgi:hypothetical protein